MDEDDGPGSLTPAGGGGGGAARWAGAAGGGGGGRFVASDNGEFPGLAPSGVEKKKKNNKKKSAVAAGGGAPQGGFASLEPAGGSVGGAGGWSSVAERGHSDALMQGAGLGRGRGRGGSGIATAPRVVSTPAPARPSFGNMKPNGGFGSLRPADESAFPNLGGGVVAEAASSQVVQKEGGKDDSDEDDKWQRNSEVRTLGGREVPETTGAGGDVRQGGRGGAVDRDLHKGKSAKEIMAGVREVVGEDRFDVFRAHSGEFRRGEIDGSQVRERERE